jgi:carbamate kinase
LAELPVRTLNGLAILPRLDAFTPVELARRGLPELAVCVLTHTVVAADDPAFGRPSKPIGPPFAYLAAGEFPEGSMGPKIRAAIEFLERGGEEVIVTSLACLAEAVSGEAGTHITRDQEC